MSMSSRRKHMPNFFDDDVVVQIDEPTPSPPPKPPRGIMRKGAPLKPQRSALKIEPVQNDSNKENHAMNPNTCSTSNPQSKFKHRDIMKDMENYFKRSIQILRSTENDFTGSEAADVITDYILKNKDSFTQENIGRHNAVKLLELWRSQKIIHAVNANQKKFEDSDRVLFRLGSEDEQTSRLYLSSSPAPSRRSEDESRVARTPSTQRSSSFKRFFPLGSLVRRNRSTSRGRDKETPKESSSTLFKSTWSLFSSSDKVDKKTRRAQRQLVKEEEAELYELALFHLLGLIEVEFLEDVALPLKDPKKSASFLTSIMEKVGLGAGEDRLDADEEDEMDLLIETHPLIRDASQWFQLARCCAPMLYLKTTPGVSQKMQLYTWCKAALAAVSARLEKLTQNGQSPLFPVEFSPLLSKIASQLINDMNSGDKLSTAVQYIFLMVPNPLRTTIDQVVHWIQLTSRTDAVEDLRSPYYLGKTGPRHRENVKVIVDELRPYIFPHNSMNNSQMDIFMEMLVELRVNGQLGQKPAQLEKSLQAKHSNANGGDLTPVRFASREPLRPKSEQELSVTDAALVEMMQNMIDDKKVSFSMKSKTFSDFKNKHPQLYKTYFSDVS